MHSYGTFYYKKTLTMSIYADDAYFKILVEKEYEEFPAWAINHNCDSFNTVAEETGKIRITVTPSNNFNNRFDDYETLVVELPIELARDVIAAIRDDDNDSMWFTKDRLNYAAKYGKVI